MENPEQVLIKQSSFWPSSLLISVLLHSRCDRFLFAEALHHRALLRFAFRFAFKQAAALSLFSSIQCFKVKRVTSRSSHRACLWLDVDFLLRSNFLPFFRYPTRANRVQGLTFDERDDRTEESEAQMKATIDSEDPSSLSKIFLLFNLQFLSRKREESRASDEIFSSTVERRSHTNTFKRRFYSPERRAKTELSSFLLKPSHRSHVFFGISRKLRRKN